MYVCMYINNWASAASPTLGCSIISRDICCRSVVCLKETHTKNTYVKKCVGGITWPKNEHAQSQLGAVNRPVTPVLFISTIR